MSKLFSKLSLRKIEFKNRIFVSPMCQYSSKDGIPTDWHLVHLGSRAVGGAALVLTEATAVTPEGRISPFDTGLWSKEQESAFLRISQFILEQGSVPGIQLAHAGRKASTDAPWKGGGLVDSDSGGWDPVAPSNIPFSQRLAVPKELSVDQIQSLAHAFEESASRSIHAGFRVVEIHMAHGYLLHEFLSPLSNHRTDFFGGSLENRMRFPLDVARRIRKVWPEEWPVFVRISASDWVPGGWELSDSIHFSRELKNLGIDLIDCSSGGLVPNAKIPTQPGYQVSFADQIKKEVGICTGAVGLIQDPHQAEKIIVTGQADVVFLARALLRDPYWVLKAAQTLNADVKWALQYERAKA